MVYTCRKPEQTFKNIITCRTSIPMVYTCKPEQTFKNIITCRFKYTFTKKGKYFLRFSHFAYGISWKSQNW